MVVTGHSTFGVNLQRWGSATDCLCKECEKEDQSVGYLVCCCLGLTENQRRLRGGELFDVLEEQADVVSTIYYKGREKDIVADWGNFCFQKGITMRLRSLSGSTAY